MDYRIEYDGKTGWTMYADDTALFQIRTIEELEDLQRLIAEMVGYEDA